MPRTTLGTTLMCLLCLMALNTPASARTLSITLGDMDGGIHNGPGSADDIYVDAQWLADLDGSRLASLGPFSDLDVGRKDHNIPFTFLFAVNPGETVAAAQLTIAIKAASSKIYSDFINLEDPGSVGAYEFDQLNWLDISASTFVVRTMNLATALGRNILPKLQDGQLNGNSLDDNIVDYITLDLTILPFGDLDGDGFVGIVDLNIVLASWNQAVPPSDARADPSGDGFVGIADLNMVLGNWNAGTPPEIDGVTNIPEPGVLGLVVLGSIVGLCKRQ